MEKHVILDVLKKSIHNLLHMFNNYNDEIIEDSHITQSICSSIEAMFLHGQMTTQTSGILSRFGRIRQPYEYDFWNFVIEFIPRDLIEALENHNFKLTSIGLCRIWLRTTLNEAIMLSYLESMIKDDKRLKRFYCKESLIRDEELMGAFCGLLKSIGHLIFHLDTSLPLLNSWVNSDALQICGLQNHAQVKSIITSSSISSLENLKSDSPANDDNSLQIILSNEEEILPTNVLISRLNNSVFTNSFLDPYLQDSNKTNIDEINQNNQSVTDNAELHNISEDIPVKEIGNIEITLSKECAFIEQNSNTMVTNECSDNQENDKKNYESSLELNYDVLDENNEYNSSTLESNFVVEIKKEYNENTLELTSEEGENIPKTEDKVEKISVPVDSFDQLWTESNFETTHLIEEVDVAVINESLGTSNTKISYNSQSSKSDDKAHSKVYSSLFAFKIFAYTTDFMNNVFQRRNFKVKESDQSWVFIGDEILVRNLELKKLMEIFPGVNESSARLGENSVFGGLCHKCHKTLETNKVFFDYYDGQLYCFNCESKTKAIIPRDVILNWDFTPKSVSETTKKFLSEIMVHPNINLATNSCLFDVVPELARVRKLRHKLSLLWLEVTSCDIETSSKVRQAMFPREYMLASVKEKDLYSLEDLIILQNGVLEKTLLNVIDKIAVPHINKCLLCKMKALACDKCRDENNLIYIHDIEYYCECSTRLCHSVIHNRCKNQSIKSFYCHRCIQYLDNQQPITLDRYDIADMND